MSARHVRVFRGRDEEETRDFLTLPHCSLFHASEVLEPRELSQKKNVQTKVSAVRSPPGLFKGSKKMESLRGFERVV